MNTTMYHHFYKHALTSFLGIGATLLFLTACEQKQNTTAKAINRDTAFVTENKITSSDIAQRVMHKANMLTEEEKKKGWKLLFDGKTTNGWRGAGKENFPDKGWVVEDGVLTVLASKGSDSQKGGDIITIDQYDSFELAFDFKLTEGANSGVKYVVFESKPSGSALGLEYQVIDDNKHPDATKGINGNRTAGSLYDLIPAKDKELKPVGEWNQGRILVQGNHVEHWLNGNKVLEYERGSKEFRDFVAKSKYAAPDYNTNGRFGEAPKGHILLQEHGDTVSFRNIKIKELSKA
jgi:hypothetical protein